MLRMLTRPVDGASLAMFRILFGAILAWEVVRYIRHGWIARYWIEPTLHFTYYGFSWVGPLPASWMHPYVALLGCCAVAISLGWRYRVCSVVFALGFTHLFLIEQARYLNHFYLICLLSLLMIAVPAHRRFSLDARRRPSLRSDSVPLWSLWLLRAQLGIVYFYAGLAKLNADWLAGEAIRHFVPSERHELLGPLLRHAAAPWVLSYGGLVLDLLVVPFLLWRRTRMWAFGAAVLFHLANVYLFRIGIFPWFMIAATTLFLDPGWPRTLLRRLPAPSLSSASTPPLSRLAAAAIALYLGIQLLVPLRHFLYPGNVHWTEEGHRFAWHMMLRRKQAEASFEVRNARTGETRTVIAADVLPRWQAYKLATRPDMIQQFCRHLADEERRSSGEQEIEVRAWVTASLHSRPFQLLVDPEVDLAGEPRNLRPAGWIVPLRDEPAGR